MMDAILRWRIKRKQKKLEKLAKRRDVLNAKGSAMSVKERNEFYKLTYKTTLIGEKIKDLQCELDWSAGRYSIEVRDNWKNGRR